MSSDKLGAQMCPHCGSEEYVWANVTKIEKYSGFWAFRGYRYRYIHKRVCKCFQCREDFKPIGADNTVHRAVA